MIWDFLLLNLSYDDFLLSNEDEEERIQILIKGGNLNEEEQIEIHQEEQQEEQEEQLYIIIEIEEPITFEYKKDYKREYNIRTALAA